MAGESVVTLREFLDSKIIDIKESVKTAYASMEKRLEGMNEFRDQLKDQASKFVTRAEIDILMSRINSDIRELLQSKANLEGKASQQSVNMALLISVISIIVGIVAIILKFV